jgi:hypothetical protein
VSKVSHVVAQQQNQQLIPEAEAASVPRERFVFTMMRMMSRTTTMTMAIIIWMIVSGVIMISLSVLDMILIERWVKWIVVFVFKIAQPSSYELDWFGNGIYTYHQQIAYEVADFSSRSCSL